MYVVIFEWHKPCRDKDISFPLKDIASALLSSVGEVTTTIPYQHTLIHILELEEDLKAVIRLVSSQGQAVASVNSIRRDGKLDPPYTCSTLLRSQIPATGRR
jgi:hypothetical protein